MKLFCAYAFTGEDITKLTELMQLVVDALNSSGHDSYCNRFDDAIEKMQTNNDVKGIFNNAFERIAASDALVAIVASPRISVGQTMEIGVAISRKIPVFLFEHSSASGASYLHKLADAYYAWDSLEDLKKVLSKI